MPSRYSYGHVPDPPGHMVTGAHRLLGALGAEPVPPRVSLSEHAVACDQFQTRSCVGWAIGQGVYVSLRKAGIVLASFPSGHGIYTLARAVDRLSTYTPLIDEGSMPNQGMRAMTEWGVPLLSDWPFEPGSIDAEPDLGGIRAASRLRLSGYYRVDDGGSGDDVVARVRQAVSRGHAVPVATLVDQAFEDYDGRGLVTAPTGNLGGHYVCVVGYDTSASGRTVVEVANSWGEGWGDRGFARCDESWLRRTTDRYVMDLRRTA